MPTAKVSVAIDERELDWARGEARRQGKSLSAVVTESLAERRRLGALREVVAWMGKGQLPLSPEELAAANRDLAPTATAATVRTARSKKARAASR